VSLTRPTLRVPVPLVWERERATCRGGAPSAGGGTTQQGSTRGTSMRERVEGRIRPSSRPKRPACSRGVSPRESQKGGQASQQIERDLTDLHACVPGHLSLEGVRDLSQDHTAPPLHVHDRPRRAPHVMHIERIFARPEPSCTQIRFPMSERFHACGSSTVVRERACRPWSQQWITRGSVCLGGRSTPSA
jgi:hypothetical protein